MAIETIKQYTSIHPHFKNRMCWRSVFTAVVGAFLLLYGGIFTPTEALEEWGLTIWVVSIALIAVGLIPYKRLLRLEKYPDELIITGKDILHYISTGPIITIDLNQIESVKYIEKSQLYGVGIYFYRPFSQPIEKPQFSLGLRILQYFALKDEKCDLFLPFFSEETAQEIETCIEALEK